MAKPEQIRVAFSPSEFAALFGKEQTWGYRQIYAGKVKTLTEYGRIKIPASEIERILASAERYNGAKAKPVRTREQLEALTTDLQHDWRLFIQKRKISNKIPNKLNVPRCIRRIPRRGGPAERSAALARLVKTKNSNENISRI